MWAAGWDQPSGTYACLWLDATGAGGLSAQAVGHAKRSGDELAFLFDLEDEIRFHTQHRRELGPAGHLRPAPGGADVVSGTAKARLFRRLVPGAIA
jgi:hypothetical protein